DTGDFPSFDFCWCISSELVHDFGNLFLALDAFKFMTDHLFHAAAEFIINIIQIIDECDIIVFKRTCKFDYGWYDLDGVLVTDKVADEVAVAFFIAESELPLCVFFKRQSDLADVFETCQHFDYYCTGFFCNLLAQVTGYDRFNYNRRFLKFSLFQTVVQKYYTELVAVQMGVFAVMQHFDTDSVSIRICRYKQVGILIPAEGSRTGKCISVFRIGTCNMGKVTVRFTFLIDERHVVEAEFFKQILRKRQGSPVQA